MKKIIIIILITVGIILSFTFLFNHNKKRIHNGCILLVDKTMNAILGHFEAHREYWLMLDNGFEFYNQGLYFISDDGNSSKIVDRKGNIIVPTGAKIICIRQFYTLGIYHGRVCIDESANTTVDEIEFVIYKNGEIKFEYPLKNENFDRKVIKKPIFL
jgi:hypothetical protein